VGIQVRCLLCGRKVAKEAAVRGRHFECHLAVKAARSREMRRLGECPQDLPCHHCQRRPATLENPNVYDHFPLRFIDLLRQYGEGLAEIPNRVVVSCKRCNEGARKRNR
jgi:hypothetical protein